MGWLVIVATVIGVAAGLAGIYGAILATITYRHQQRESVRQRLESQRLIRVTCEMGSLRPAPGHPNLDVALLEQDSPEHPSNAVILIGRNEGFRTVWPSRAGFRLPNGLYLPITTPIVVSGFPCAVHEGQAVAAPQDARVLARDLLAAGFTGKVRLLGYFIDLLDNIYESEPFDFDVDAWRAEAAS